MISGPIFYIKCSTSGAAMNRHFLRGPAMTFMFDPDGNALMLAQDLTA